MLVQDYALVPYFCCDVLLIQVKILDPQILKETTVQFYTCNKYPYYFSLHLVA